MTGTSRGLGLDLVRRLLERGDRGAATTRSSERLLTAPGTAPTPRVFSRSPATCVTRRR
ncbi:hypothetical protein [Streptomyces incanus]|uniref:Histidine kinase/HSP90-like ATPase domain-containing protein n=1 Tax=Streptomyces incanus TaxID=887453 RepID=A0ABW0XPP0_9ACTN